MEPSSKSNRTVTPGTIILIVFCVLAISGAACFTLALRGIIPLSLPDGAEALQDLAWRIANFSVLVVVLHILLTRRIVEFFTNRRAAIEEALESAQKQKEAAEKRHAEISKKLSSAKKEIEDISATFLEEGKASRDLIIANAQKEAEKIHIQAKHTIEQEMKKARLALRAEAVDLSVALAEELLKKSLKKEDLERIIKEYIEKTAELA